jgi:hypothetical protein
MYGAGNQRTVFGKGEKQMVVKGCLIILGALLICAAGPNSAALFYFDFDPGTEAIDSAAQCAAGDSITIPLKVGNASRLYDYQVYVKYDTAQLRYLSVKKGNAQLGNILETNGGSIVFTGKRSINDSTKILIGCVLLGSEPTECVSGNGIMGLITFKKKNADDSRLTLTSPVCEDCDLRSDTAMQCHGAIIQSTPVSILSRKGRRIGAAVRIRNGRILMQLPGTVSYDLAVFDPRGKKRYSAAGHSSVIDIKAPEGMSASGVCLARLRYQNCEVVLPLVNQ